MSSNSTRRSFLAAISGFVAASSAGCLGQSLFSFSSEPVPPEEYSRTVSVTRVDSVPGAYGAEFGISVAQSEITAERTAVLRSRITSTSEEERQFSAPYYKGSSSQNGVPGILLYAENAPGDPAYEVDSLENYAPPCVGTDGKSRDRLLWTLEARVGPTLTPNESWSERLLVVDDPTRGGCIPVGTYRFESVFSPSWMDGRFDWGFTLEVSD